MPYVMIALVTSAICSLGMCQVPWHTDLAYPGGGYWPVRVRVSVYNAYANDLRGIPVNVTVGEGANQANIGGLPAESIRVCTAAGQELLFGCTDVDGLPRRSGPLVPGDSITLPMEAQANGSADLYIYAGNTFAWAPPEYLGGTFANGSFELGEDGPANWNTWGVDDRHRMFWQQGGARTGSRCARCEVDPGSEATWVKYYQGPITVTPGAKYRFTAWVRAQEVVGNAGWYIHVNGDKPQLINRSGAWPGTFDWREVVIEFEVPPTGTDFQCGTMLHGTGTAWFDDAKLELLSDTKLEMTVGPAERMQLHRIGSGPQWKDPTVWPWCTPMIVRNFTNGPTEAVLISANAHRPRTLLAKHAEWRYDLPVRVIDPDSTGEPLPCTWVDGRLLCMTSIPAQSEKTLLVFWSPWTNPSDASPLLPLSKWATSPLNLAKNGGMELAAGEDASDWPSEEEGRPKSSRFTVRRVGGGVEGDWCLELNVPDTGEPVGWVGSRQSVAVKPNTRYILAAHISSQGVRGEARVYGHFRKSDGSLSDFSPYFNTSPPVTGTQDWTFTSAQVTTPPDCGFIQIHLTMNTTGTLRHDGVMLIQVANGEIGAIEGVSTEAQEPLSVWPVNPMVKVFHDDWPLAGERQVRLYACRNEREPFQIALRAKEPLSVSVTASEIQGPGGNKLAPPAIYQVGYVPIDFPIGYASSTQPAYHRLKPSTPGNDGWAGLWPDPLIPLSNPEIELPADQTQALWLDLGIPAEAQPGEYRGWVEFTHRNGTARITVELTVWPFTLPERKHCKAIYDLRRGMIDIFPGGQGAESVAMWYRFLSEYNVSPGLIYPEPQFRYENGRVTIDYKGFDEACELLFDNLHGNAAYTPGFFYALGWAYPPKKYFDHEPFTAEWNAIFQSALRDFYAHLRERGWDKYFVYYLSDEPHEQAPGVIDNLARICDLAREAVPDIVIYSSTWTHIRGLDGHVNLWGIGPHGSFPLPEVEERRTRGDRFWFTTDGQMCTDTPYLGIERLLPWFCFKYGVEAYEFWGVSWWTYDPWKYGWHMYIRQSNEGTDYYWVRYPNGDGFLAYPGGPLGRKEPVPSIRLMAAREGVEDYEVFHELAKYAQENPIANNALDQVRALVTIPNAGGRNSTHIMPNPDAVLQARIAAGEALSKIINDRTKN